MIFDFCNRSMLLVFTVLFSATFSAFAQTSPNQPLILNLPIESSIKGGEAQFFVVNLLAGSTAQIEIEQQGIDVSLVAYNLKGEKFIETESPSGVMGNDLILVTAAEAGEYKIAVEPANPKAAAGKYQIKLTEIRPTVPEDNRINEATKEISRLANETPILRAQGTREGRRQAIENFRQVIELSRVKKDVVWEIVAIVQMGIIYDQLGEFQQSIEAHERGLQLSREIGNREYVGSALNNIGLGYKTLGDCEKAILYLNQSDEIAREMRDKRAEAFTLNNLGGCYLMLGDLPKARDFFERSLVLHREVKNQRNEANGLNNLGQLYAKTGEREKAIDFFQQALRVRREIGDKAGEAVPLQNLGRIYLAAGDQVKALENFEQANRLARQVGDRRVEGNSYYWLAQAEKTGGNTAKAIENIERGLALIEQIRGELVNPELRIAYFSSVQQFYDLYTELLFARYEKSKNETDVALALEISERARTRSFVELLQEARVNIKQGVDQKTLEQAEDLQNALNQKYRQRTQVLSGGKATPEQIAKITAEINSLTGELETVQVKIRRDNPRYAGLTETATISAVEIQNLLDDETVLLEYKLGDTRSFLWLVSKNAVKIYTLPARKEIEKTAREFYDSVSVRDSKNQTKTAKLAGKLSEILLAPIAANIKDKRLAIVADGILQFIPFAALTGRNEIVGLPSASVLMEIRRGAGKTGKPEKTLAIFADPIFEADDPRLSAKAEKREKSAEINKLLRDFNLGETLPRLLSTRVEAKNIAAFAPKNQADLNIDFDANRQNADTETLARYRILHFATHGFLDASRPELSGLVLSLYDKNGKPQDGFLRLNQIYNLNLNSDLVVLSACQTALGKDVRGEGLIGLTRGFIYAGARRVIASLWKVDDAATAEFMRRFYQNLLQKKQTPTAALRSAQNEMKQMPRFRAPYFWAGFTLQGEWR